MKRFAASDRIALYSLALLILLTSIALLTGGAYLIYWGGSPYYLICGLGGIAAAVLLWMRRSAAVWLYLLTLCATIAWAIWESGWDFWALAARIAAPSFFALAFLLPPIARALGYRASRTGLIKSASALVAAGLGGAGFNALVPPERPADPLWQAGVIAEPSRVSTAGQGPLRTDWQNFGSDIGGSRFSPLDQITPANVHRLDVAWRAHLGPTPNGLQVTPLNIGDRLYVCNNRNDVIALDADTGKQVWRFDSGADIRLVPHPVCRGVSYHREPEAHGLCAERIITTTVDARLIALDAATGRRCPQFGRDGEVSLLEGMGQVIPGYYYPTSAPLVAQGRIVVGGWCPTINFGVSHQAQCAPSMSGPAPLSGRGTWVRRNGARCRRTGKPIRTRRRMHGGR